MTAIALAGVLVSIALGRLRLPTVAGLLAAGVLLGPSGLGMVGHSHSIDVLAEVGVVLLLFSIGLEFSLERMRHIFRTVALGGLLQVVGTIGVVAAVAVWAGLQLRPAIFLGFVFALSSTAVVLRLLAERRELDAPHGQFIVGTLIFQDLCIVPMVLLVPVLAKGGDPLTAARDVGTALGKAALVVALTLALARFVVPKLFALVDAQRSREVFLLAVVALCIGTAWLTSLAGLSLALGAFLGGMVVADTDFRHRALGEMLPLRDIFVSLFFVSLGMLFDAGAVAERPLAFAAALGGFVVVKGAVATGAALLMRFPPRAGWLAGVGLAQFGEFGFVLLKTGHAEGVMDGALLDPILSAGIASMFITPLLVRWAPHLTAGERLLAPLARLLGARAIGDEPEQGEGHLSDHVLIIGYGVAGRMVGRALQALEHPFAVIELNAKTVRESREAGEPVYYGDATSEEVLEHAGVHHARAVVVLINDPAAAMRVVATIHRIAPDVPLLLRARYVAEIAGALEAGAEEVVAEEVEAGVELLARILRRLEVPRNHMDVMLAEARISNLPAERRVESARLALSDQRGLDELRIESVVIEPESPACGVSLAELDLRRRTGALIISLRRDGALLPALGPEIRFQPGDILYLVGDDHDVARAVALTTTISPSPAT